MYVVLRKISPYSGLDIILGCFDSLPAAQKVRELYLLPYQNGERVDPWKEQVFYTVNLENDVIILDTIPEFDIPPGVEKVTIVTSIAEGFGQKVMKIHAICGSEESIRASFSEVQKSLDGYWPEECRTRQVKVGELLTDDKDRHVLAPHTKTLRDLKKNKDLNGAETFLVDQIAYHTAKDRTDGLGINGWYYLELARIYGSRRNYSKEVAVLEEFARQESKYGEYSGVLAERLTKAREKLASKSNNLR
jgi:hypothetical protein